MAGGGNPPEEETPPKYTVNKNLQLKVQDIDIQILNLGEKN